MRLFFIPPKCSRWLRRRRKLQARRLHAQRRLVAFVLHPWGQAHGGQPRSSSWSSESCRAASVPVPA